MSVALTRLTRLVGVQWDGGLVDQNLLRALARSGAEHLSLRYVMVERPSAVLPFWTLRSLHLDITPLWDEKVERRLLKNGSMTAREREQAHQERVTDSISFTVSLLKQCAPTLERFLWVNSDEKHLSNDPVSLGDLEFPRLRHFRSHSIPFAADTLASLYAAPLDELELGWGKKYQQDRGNYVRNLVSLPRLPQLRALALGRLEMYEEVTAMVVLQNHTHLKQLSIERADSYFLDHHVVPLLGSGLFTTLTSLSLFWEEIDMELGGQMPVVIDEACLAAIGTIVSLEQLCLEAGHITMELDDSCRHFLDHARVRKHFRGLTRLRNLAFGRQWEPDSIDQDSGHARRPNQLERGRACERPALDKEMSWIETVKERCKLQHQQTAGMQDDSDLDDPYRELPDLEIRKLSHRNFFLAEAEQYAGALPNLEWLFIGQWPIAISQPSSSHFGNAVPLSYGWIVSYAWEELKNSIFTLGNWDTMTHEVSEDVMRDRRIAFLRNVGSSQGHACPGRNLSRIDRRPTR
ncbi:hypothetical protein LTR56_010698 [Elasticomyces elasticus]|nr:hypothetical protein LTR56_010698 [Elasticomyces elasticus]KAK3655368.1 hypothetical protein LTR22_010253 [Elasticomyces elasticus]KAK4922102.1 hypothetical protein LTR49_010513 [Elasticomyces elasticus]KAK5750963.1 hypothetical protein LTS12_018953 [Elasticomyces elasticus]